MDTTASRRDLGQEAIHGDDERVSLAELAAALKDLRQRQEQLIALVCDETIGRRRNVKFLLEEQSLRETAAFVGERMSGVEHFAHPDETLRHALSLAPKGGLALEFGVASGRTLRLIAGARADDRVWGFDSFEGLPEAWRPGFPAGTFATSRIPKVPGTSMVVGWFDKTLPKFLEDHPRPVDFIHFDCDLYSSTRTVLDLLGDRLRPGSVVLFDEYFNYPGWQQHEHRAWQEFAERSGVRFRYEGYTFNNEQVAIRIVE